MKNVYIHIGFSKTGTTAIQAFFAKNRHQFLQQGLLIPETGLQNIAHHFLAPNKEDGMTEKSWLLYSQLRDEILQSPAHNVLISSEFYSFVRPNFIADIQSTLSPFKIKVIFYVRSQEPLIESLYLQWQKTGTSDYLGSVENFYKKHKMSFDFITRISPWANSFGEEAIIARLYERKLIGDDVCNDMMSILGVKKPENSEVEIANPSLRAEFSNLVCLIDAAKVNRPNRNKIIRELLALSESLDSTKKQRLIKPEFSNEITNFFRASNLEFASKYLSPEHAVYFCK